MADAEVGDLEGNTLSVYAFVVKEGKPVGPREVMRGTNLSSPSTAYRQLQKLESMGLIEKTVYGTYVAKEKTSISGHVWIGKNLVPRLICYALFFFGILITEVTILVTQFFSQGLTPNLALLYLVPVTASAVGLFLAEGIVLWQRNKRASIEK
ncbi:MAG: hypothetical protein FWD52_05845 [Candidatus Bathyarchaeota archaeon]|nr:hypothetical protein [Candidatus Termiticorpusculum sp.]